MNRERDYFNVSKIKEGEEYNPGEIALEYINKTNTDDTFVLLNLNKINEYKKLWETSLPQFSPFYAMKSNNEEHVLKRMIELGMSFDAASPKEIETLLELGCSTEKIIYANPCKQVNHILYAKSVNVKLTVVDSVQEAYKIQKYYPESDFLMRLHVENDKALYKLNDKFGANKKEAGEIMDFCIKNNLNLKGISIHIGSGSSDASGFSKGIQVIRETYDEAIKKGLNFKIIDIGGGFTSNKVELNPINTKLCLFDDQAKAINNAMRDLFNEKEQKELFLISEPGYFFSNSLFASVVKIVNFKIRGDKVYYFLSEGVYGSLCVSILEPFSFFPDYIIKNNVMYSLPELIKMCEKNEYKNEFELKLSVFWGPTCDSLDIVCRNPELKLPLLSTEDWLIFDNKGSYSYSLSTNFNGFTPPKVVVLKEEKLN